MNLYPAWRWDAFWSSITAVKPCHWSVRTVKLDQEHDPKERKRVYMHQFYEAEIQSMVFIVIEIYNKNLQARGNVEGYLYLESVIMYFDIS